MKKHKQPPAPARWEDVKTGEGKIVGCYAVTDHIITVRYPDGREKRAMASASGANGGLAMMLLAGL